MRTEQETETIAKLLREAEYDLKPSECGNPWPHDDTRNSWMKQLADFEKKLNAAGYVIVRQT